MKKMKKPFLLFFCCLVFWATFFSSVFAAEESSPKFPFEFFGLPLWFATSVHSLSLQQDGKIMIGGNISSDGSSIDTIIHFDPQRLLSVWSIFWNLFSNGSTASLSLQDDGQISMNGSFIDYTWTSLQYAVALSGKVVTSPLPDIIAPTASVHYSCMWDTSDPVIVILTGYSEPLTWHNQTIYVFTENGKFVFTYQDLAGNTWKTEAVVTWIHPKLSPVLPIWWVWWWWVWWWWGWWWWGGWWWEITHSAPSSLLSLSWTLLPPSLPSSQSWILSVASEQEEAFIFAKSIGITTKDTMKDADMPWKLIRSHMAKMIVNFAVKLLEKHPDETKMCSFSDIIGESLEMQSYSKLACQLGLMWIEANGKTKAAFDPKETVDRAQFGTILSRFLWWSTYEGGEIYYQKHLLALQKEGIMKNIDQPSSDERRGWVMIMLKRIFDLK